MCCNPEVSVNKSLEIYTKKLSWREQMGGAWVAEAQNYCEYTEQGRSLANCKYGKNKGNSYLLE